jgi:formate hydrogenlyase subunit 3/multisubunit Na+/H+ antiporter MnhD subunit
MSATSFLLVVDHGRARSRNAAVKYLIQMQVGAALLLTGIGLATLWGKGLSFAALATILDTPTGWTVAVPLILGFAMKAGVVPLHTWLPDAHGSAPSHVSGVLSGVMVKVGIYGLLRVLLLSHDHAVLFGAPLMVAGMITALYGIAQSAVQNDVKRVLAYSTVENMGLIVLNIGLALVATGSHAPVIATVAWSAVLLHMVHHMLVKTTAFQSVGVIVHATHTQDLNAMGGLLKILPRAGTLLMLAALSISAIPPLSGFISEYGMFAAAIRAMGDANTSQSILALFAVLTICVVGGMTIVAMTKTIGIGLLGSPRSSSVPAYAHESWRLLAAPVVAAIGLLAVGLAPAFVLDALSGLLFQFPSSDESALQSLRGTYVAIGWMNASLIGLSLAMVLVRNRVRASRPVAEGPTWGCGFTTADARVQYTSTTYGDSVVSLAEGFVHVHRELRPIDESDTFPHARAMHTHHRDQVERLALDPAASGIVAGLRRLAVFQTGNLRTYILYALGFLIVFAALTLLGVI